MIRIVTADGSLIDPALEALEATLAAPIAAKIDTTIDVQTPAELYSADARRAAGMKFLAEVGLTLDDRLMSDDVQGIIDSVLFNQVGDKAA